jgi:predicted DNA-binding transcriptional regulator AlpA
MKPTETHTTGALLLTPEDLLYAGEIAWLADVEPQTIHQWIARYPDFPKPWKAGNPGQAQLWLRTDILGWFAATGRRWRGMEQ